MSTRELLYRSGVTMQVLSTDSTPQTRTMFLMENAASLSLNTGLKTRLETYTNNVKEQLKLIYPKNMYNYETMAGTNFMSIYV